MPQLNQLALVYASQWFWLLLVLGIIYMVIGRGMVPQIEATVDKRNARIAADIAAAEKARADASGAEAALEASERANREAAHAIVASAKAKADDDAAKRVAKADKDLAERQAHAEAALAAARGEALASIDEVAAEATQDIVARVAGMKITAAAAAKAVNAVVSHHG